VEKKKRKVYGAQDLTEKVLNEQLKWWWFEDLLNGGGRSWWEENDGGDSVANKTNDDDMRHWVVTVEDKK
jgi:hypothetical protein